MLKITKEKMDILGKVQEKKFISDMVRHIKKEFPDQSKEITDSDIEELVIQEIQKAEGYGIESRSDICLYLNIVMIHGTDFDKEFKWANNILNNKSELTGSARMMELYDKAIDNA